MIGRTLPSWHSEEFTFQFKMMDRTVLSWQSDSEEFTFDFRMIGRTLSSHAAAVPAAKQPALLDILPIMYLMRNIVQQLWLAKKGETCCFYFTGKSGLPAVCIAKLPTLLDLLWSCIQSEIICNICDWQRKESHATFKIQDYYLIREIKTWLNMDHITVHNNRYFMF